MSPSTTTQAVAVKSKFSKLRSVVWSLFHGFVGFALIIAIFYHGPNRQSVAISFSLSACTYLSYIEDGKKKEEAARKEEERRIRED
ncbi:hypothetical protein IFR05_010225, partial [Cadophora sp. M221]